MYKSNQFWSDLKFIAYELNYDRNHLNVLYIKHNEKPSGIMRTR